MNNKHANNKKKNPNDIIYTPLPVAKEMINMIDDYEGKRVLDPSKGGGVFYDNLPNNCIKDYCEITEGIDFFEYNKPVDIIIGNPPYSLWNKWIEKSIELNPEYICYIMNVYNMTAPRLKIFENANYGLIRLKIIRVEWWFGTSYIALFKKNSKSIIEIMDKRVYCDICNKNCRRGKDGNGMNECTNQKIQ